MAKKLLLLLLLVPPRQSLESIMLKQYPPMELDITISIGSQPESKENQAKRTQRVVRSYRPFVSLATCFALSAAQHQS